MSTAQPQPRHGPSHSQSSASQRAGSHSPWLLPASGNEDVPDQRTLVHVPSSPSSHVAPRGFCEPELPIPAGEMRSQDACRLALKPHGLEGTFRSHGAKEPWNSRVAELGCMVGGGSALKLSLQVPISFLPRPPSLRAPWQGVPRRWEGSSRGGPLTQLGTPQIPPREARAGPVAMEGTLGSEHVMETQEYTLRALSSFSLQASAICSPIPFLLCPLSPKFIL